MTDKNTFQIKAPNGQSMAADLTFNTQSTPRTFAIYAHGINGFKDWGGMDSSETLQI